MPAPAFPIAVVPLRFGPDEAVHHRVAVAMPVMATPWPRLPDIVLWEMTEG